MQIKLGDQREQHVAERSGRKNVGEVGPGERGHVAGKEAYEQDNAGDDEGVDK